MIAYIIEHIAFYLRSVFLTEVAVGHRHVMLEEGVFRYHRFLPDHHGVFGRIILIEPIVGMLLLIIMYDA